MPKQGLIRKAVPEVHPSKRALEHTQGRTHVAATAPVSGLRKSTVRQTREPQAKQADTPLDSIDLHLLDELQENARISFAELARRVHLSTPAVIDRVHRLEQTGVILRYRAEIDPAALGLRVRAFVKVTVAGDRLSNFTRIAQKVPEIIECHRVTGNESFIVQVAVRDMTHLERVIDSLMPYLATNSSMVLNSPVEGARFAMADSPAPSKGRRTK